MQKAKTAAQALDLESIPNIGPVVAADLHQLGIHTPEDLIGQDPYVLYQQLCAQTGVMHDPCLLDTFIAATRFMAGNRRCPGGATPKNANARSRPRGLDQRHQSNSHGS